MSEGASNLSQKQLEKLTSKAKDLGYSNLAFFIDDLDMLLRSANLLKQKDMKYFELENLITLLINKDISLGMAPRMISMVSKYSERNEELETENNSLKQSNITMQSKYQTAEAQVKELQKQIQDLSAGARSDAKIKEENIKLSEENKYLKMTNKSLTEDFKKTKDKLEKKLEEANNLELENSQLELRMKDHQRELKEIELELTEEKSKVKGRDETRKRIEDLIEELDELYPTTDDPFKREFIAFMGVELSEIADNRNITKQKILNQIAIHAREIEKIFEPRMATVQPTPVAPARQTMRIETPVEPSEVKVEPFVEEPKEVIPEPVKRQPIKEEPVAELVEDIDAEDDVGDRYVKPSEFLKGKSIHSGEAKEEAPKVEAKVGDAVPAIPQVEEEIAIPKPKPVSIYKKKKMGKPEPMDRTPSADLVKVFDVFVKYLEAITDNSSFNDLCDKLIEELYEHVGSPGMTQVYKIKSGGVKRKQMLIDLIKKWQIQLPEM
ncbi:MAG: hypothetical protein KGD59_15890 [Candidatus Heimdallarchaeota archaeon]|nr:hypothetical protein [Candidatus Heimdallarchaeota archaeon]MBY8996032.1 hypothetical protein [Candidatus Heimdallarchaeota archaeon]